MPISKAYWKFIPHIFSLNGFCGVVQDWKRRAREKEKMESIKASVKGNGATQTTSALLKKKTCNGFCWFRWEKKNEVHVWCRHHKRFSCVCVRVGGLECECLCKTKGKQRKLKASFLKILHAFMYDPFYEFFDLISVFGYVCEAF